METTKPYCLLCQQIEHVNEEPIARCDYYLPAFRKAHRFRGCGAYYCSKHGQAPALTLLDPKFGVSEEAYGVDKGQQVRTRAKMLKTFRRDKPHKHFKEEECLIRFCQTCEPKYLQICRKRRRDQVLWTCFLWLLFLALVALCGYEQFYHRNKLVQNYAVSIGDIKDQIEKVRSQIRDPTKNCQPYYKYSEFMGEGSCDVAVCQGHELIGIDGNCTQVKCESGSVLDNTGVGCQQSCLDYSFYNETLRACDSAFCPDPDFSVDISGKVCTMDRHFYYILPCIKACSDVEKVGGKDIGQYYKTLGHMPLNMSATQTHLPHFQLTKADQGLPKGTRYVYFDELQAFPELLQVAIGILSSQKVDIAYLVNGYLNGATGEVTRDCGLAVSGADQALVVQDSFEPGSEPVI